VDHAERRGELRPGAEARRSTREKRRSVDRFRGPRSGAPRAAAWTRLPQTACSRWGRRNGHPLRRLATSPSRVGSPRIPARHGYSGRDSGPLSLPSPFTLFAQVRNGQVYASSPEPETRAPNYLLQGGVTLLDRA
jgi:hypothetical protein